MTMLTRMSVESPVHGNMHAGFGGAGRGNGLADKAAPRPGSTLFVGFSYGFRPGRGPHDALDALSVGLTRKKVNWVLDADIRSFFTEIDREWMLRFLEHRIGDERVLRLIRKWLNAGIIEDGDWSDEGKGTPQGASLSPLLANVYLHYVFDLWAMAWRNQHVNGDMIVLRFADDGAPRMLKGSVM